MRVAVVWPKPRKAKWRRGQATPSDCPDLSDALLGLSEHGIDVSIEESLPAPWNPLAGIHEFYSGLDPLRAVRIAARARRYDAILCVGDATAFVLVWLRRAFKLGMTIILIDPALSPGYPRRKRLQDYVMPRVDHVILFGRVQVDYVAREYEGTVRASFVYHRADVNFYKPSDATQIPSDPYVFSIGLDESRDFETLAEAARRCRQELGVQHRFLLQTTRAVAQPGVLEINREPVSYVRLRELYRQASVVVLPLHDRLHAGGINTLLEAMATGRPVVVSASRGIADYVTDGETARVVEAGNAQAMSRAIADLLAAPQAAQQLGENARKFVVERCQNGAYAASLADIIRRTVAASLARDPK
jgi:glycosyltransferase involved in cell wall biosynthesis